MLLINYFQKLNRINLKVLVHLLQKFSWYVKVLAPEIIDPRLLDPKFALAEVENDPDAAASQANEKITSLKKLLTTKRNRGGYEEGLSTTLYAECNL